MARSLTAAVITEITSQSVIPIILVKLEFDSADLNVWTGIGNLTYSGDVYLGTGNIGGISPIEESANLKANGVTLSLSGIPSSLISSALSEDYQDRPATIWFGVFDTSQSLIADPIQIFKGRMDVIVISEAGESTVLELSIENELVHLERPNERRYTPQDQQLLYPADKGFGFVANIQDKQIIWK